MHPSGRTKEHGLDECECGTKIRGFSTQKKKIGARSITDQVDNGLKLLGPLSLTDGKVYAFSPLRNVQKLVQSGSRGAGAFGGGGLAAGDGGGR